MADGLGGVTPEAPPTPGEALRSPGGEAGADPTGEKGTQRSGGAVPPSGRRGVLAAVLGQGADGRGFSTRRRGVYYYNLERPHYEEGMVGRPLFQALRELGYHLPQKFALFLLHVLNRISADWALRGGNDLSTH